MKPVDQSLFDLSKAYVNGDKTAFEPFIDCLLENGLVNHAKRVWAYQRLTGSHSAFSWLNSDLNQLWDAEKQLGGWEPEMKCQEAIERFKGA